MDLEEETSVFVSRVCQASGPGHKASMQLVLVFPSESLHLSFDFLDCHKVNADTNWLCGTCGHILLLRGGGGLFQLYGADSSAAFVIQKKCSVHLHMQFG